MSINYVTGMNFLPNSDFVSTTTRGAGKNPDCYPSNWHGRNSGLSNPENLYHAHVDTTTFTSNNVICYNESDGSRNWKSIHVICTDILNSIESDCRETLTLSMDVYRTGKVDCFGGFYYTKEGDAANSFASGLFYLQKTINDLPENEWHRVSIKVPYNFDKESTSTVYLYIYGYNFPENAILYIDKVKLAFGKPDNPLVTTWTASPADSAAQKTNSTVRSLANNIISLRRIYDGVGITNIEEYYAVSTSGSTAPATSSFATTIPTMSTTNKYLWNYEKISYTDSSSKSTTPVVIGVYGATGAAGKGIKQIDNYYMASASGSGVTTSTSGWSAANPSPVPTTDTTKKYLWNYEKTTFTDNTTASTTPRIISTHGATGAKGDKGDKGDTGVGISSVTEYYAVGTSSSTAPTSFQTTIPTMTATNRYLWNYEVIAYTNSTSTTTSKKVIGVYGATGGTGATGNGIKSIENRYLASTLNEGVTVSLAGWTTTVQQTTVDIPYLWNYEIITYTNGGTVTTEPRMIGGYGGAGQHGISMSITSTNGFQFKNTNIATVLTAHVYTGSTEAKGTALTALGAVKWYKNLDFTTAIGIGQTLTINSGTVGNSVTITARLEI